MPSLPRLPGRRSDRRSADGGPGPVPAGRPGTASAGREAAGSDTGPDAAAAGAGLGELVARVADDSADRRGQLAALARAVAGAARGAGSGAHGLGQVLADALADAAPRIPVRDGDTLRAHHSGRTDHQIADALVRNAARTTAGFGAAVGAVAAVEFAAPPTYLAAPVQLAAEALAVAAVEVKLVAELHELYGEPASGPGSQRGAAYLMSWVRQRAVDAHVGVTGLSTVLGYAAKRELRTALMRRMGRSLTKLAPFLAGAAAGAAVNQRATRGLGEKVAAELWGRHTTVLPG